MAFPPPPIVEKPEHVPADLVRDVDFYHLIHGEQDAQEAWRRVQVENPDIFWTPRNGGHWIATRAADMETIITDHERFSVRITVLPAQPRLHTSMLNMDPPQHTPFRRLITPAFLPKSVAALETKVRELARKLVDELEPRGECEFVADFAKVLPIVVFLGMVDLPVQDAPMLLPWAEDMVRGEHGKERAAAELNMSNYLATYVDARIADPGDDLISFVANGMIGDRKITREEVMATCSLLLFGGLDTVASILGFIARFLAMHPEHRHRLVAEPALIPHATEELMRRHGLPNQSRVLVSDLELNGVSLREGDIIQWPSCLYGLDDRLNPDPLTVDFDRPAPIRHGVFGSGAHTCPGAVLARREVRVFLEEWLPRIPDFWIKPGSKPKIATGPVNGVSELHLCWTPSQRRATQ